MSVTGPPVVPNPLWAKLPLFDRTGWRRVAFGDFAESIGERAEPKDAQDEIYVGLEHLDSQSLHIRRWGKGSDVTGTKLRFRKGDIIFGRRRAYQRKLAVAEFDGICSAHAMVVRAKPDKVLPEFLPFLMMSDRFMSRAVEISVGSLSPTINWMALKLEAFDLPPLNQQRRIAEILWAADDVLSQHLKARDEAQEAYKSTVTDFFFGHRIDSPTALFNPKWKTLQLQDVGASDAPIRYGIVQVGGFCEDGVPTVAIKNLSGRFGDELHKTAPKIENQYAASRVKPGDLLLSIKASVGDVGIVPSHFHGNISRDLARIRCGPLVDPRLLLHLFRSERYQAYITKHVVGSTRKEISIHHLRKFETPLPPHDIARDFIDRAETAAKFVAISIQHCERIRMLAMAMLNQLLSPP